VRIPAILCATTLAAASAGLAHAGAVNLIRNGDFASTSLHNPVPTQFGPASGNGYTASQFITNWVGNNGYEIWYPNATAAVNEEAYSQWGQGTNFNNGQGTGNETLWSVTAPPVGPGSFVGLDGDSHNGVASSISQMLTGLSVGTSYSVSFAWAGAQMQSRTGATTDMLAVSLSSNQMTNLNYNYNSAIDPANGGKGCGSNGSWQVTCALSNASMGFTGWKNDTMTFTATSGSEWLNFLSVGTPSSLPPMALLTDVSLTQVQAPEPGALALLGGGLLALGFALIQRRRAQRDRA
jgi:hypothetical protein